MKMYCAAFNGCEKMSLEFRKLLQVFVAVLLVDTSVIAEESEFPEMEFSLASGSQSVVGKVMAFYKPSDVLNAAEFVKTTLPSELLDSHLIVIHKSDKNTLYPITKPIPVKILSAETKSELQQSINKVFVSRLETLISSQSAETQPEIADQLQSLIVELESELADVEKDSIKNGKELTRMRLDRQITLFRLAQVLDIEGLKDLRSEMDSDQVRGSNVRNSVLSSAVMVGKSKLVSSKAIKRVELCAAAIKYQEYSLVLMLSQQLGLYQEHSDVVQKAKSQREARIESLRSDRQDAYIARNTPPPPPVTSLAPGGGSWLDAFNLTDSQREAAFIGDMSIEDMFDASQRNAYRAAKASGNTAAMNLLGPDPDAPTIDDMIRENRRTMYRLGLDL
ncbi:hypothetical protein N9D38_12090 [Rubripirellula sp.]|nr:hypothetical protein [Rubripirellula sp.]